MAGADYSKIDRPEIMQHFSYEHLPPNLREISEPFCNMAERMLLVLPNNQQRAVLLQKLLEAKDAAVRAALDGKG